MTEKISSYELPRSSFNPVWGSGSFALFKCEYGCNEEATQTFLANDFECVWLQAQRNQNITIPALGEKARRVKFLFVVGSGTITGLEQFRELESISITSFPKNGIDFDAFGKLKRVSMDWDKKFIDSVFACKNIRELNIEGGYPEVDCQRYGALPQLTDVGFTHGRLENLNGLEACTHLEGLALAGCRNFSSLGDLTRFKHLQTLSLHGLPKLQWDGKLCELTGLTFLHLQSLPTLRSVIFLNGLCALEEISVLQCPDATVDLSAINTMPNLRKVHLNKPHAHLNLDDLFSRRRLEMVFLEELDELAESDDALVARAEQHGRRISTLERLGPKKSRAVFIEFANSEN